jgi:general stress protein 26
MENDYKLLFIKNKLQQIKSAVMYSTNSNTVRLPNDIVEFESVDDDGLLWFSAHIPRHWVKAYELHFPAKLIFYRKGVEYYVEITGTAVVVNKQDVMHGFNHSTGKLLLKMVPYYIEYTEIGKKEAGFRKLKGQVYDIFMNTLGLGRTPAQPRLAE